MKREMKTWPGRKVQAQSTLPEDLQKRIQDHVDSVLANTPPRE